MLRFYSLVVLLLYLNISFITACTIRISNQQEFDDAVRRINEGEELHLRLIPGTYILHETIKSYNPISIKGNRATITCSRTLTKKQCVFSDQSHDVYKVESPFSLFTLFYDDNGALLKISESVIDSVGVNYLEGDIISPNDNYNAGAEIKIPISANLNRLKNKSFSYAFGYFDSGWGIVNFKLEKSDDRYFYCTTLNKCLTKDYHYDRNAYHKKVRYVIYNAEKKTDAIYYDSNFLYVPKEVDALHYINQSDGRHSVPGIVTYSDIEFSNINFLGFGCIHVKSESNAECVIKDCSFKNSLGYSVIIDKVNDKNTRIAYLKDCTFEDCSILLGNIVRLTSTVIGNTCIVMSGCRLNRYSCPDMVYKNPTGTVFADGDIYILKNEISNTCRDHIYLSRGHIIVKDNVLYNDDDFSIHEERNLSNDWGLIYCSSFSSDKKVTIFNTNNTILIENNLLYGACSYAKDSRGIFIDSGRGDVICKNNVIFKTQDYSIDSRIIKASEASSVRNRYEGNVVSKEYRLLAGPAVIDGNMPVTNGNIILNGEKGEIINTRVENNDIIEKQSSDYTCNGRKILISENLYGQLKRMPSWKTFKNNILKK